MDKFYTKPNIAAKCLKFLQKFISFDDYDFIVEPSAGNGSFYYLLPEEKRIGMDIMPECNVEKKDYFNFTPEIFFEENNLKKKYLVVGNPPFGKVSSLAVKFFNKSAEFCDCIAFILPRTFNRISIANKLNLNFSLIFTKNLPDKNCFTPPMNAKCCFQIWRRTEIPRKLIILKQKNSRIFYHKDFEFLKFGPKDSKNQPTPPKGADFAIKAYGSNCGEIVTENLNSLRPKSWHWIKAKIDIETLKKNFNSLDYSISKNTVRQESIGKGELVMLYSEFLTKKIYL